ncbi:MAG: twin-arginine translocase subunit TatC [Proteobacteria bacterium]|nr:twin-arginine translocase subunit TatC [Pseudomonadota bacterium]
MDSAKKITLTQHLIELRQRLVYCLIALFVIFVISYVFSQEIFNFLLQPLLEVYGEGSNKRVIYTGPAEAFMTYVKISFLSAIFFSLPIIITQFYLFIAPGLYKSEKKLTLSILLSSPLLFIAGAALAYYLVFPLAFKFFVSFESSDMVQALPIELEARISEYLKLVIQFIFAFGIAFQLPILLIFLVRAGVISIQTLKSKRKYWILLIFIIAAILTPPDVLSQIALAVPMMLLYEIAILISAKITKKID